MSQKIKIKRGLKNSLPTLDIGEPAFCTDTKELYIGSSTENVLVGTNPSSSSNNTYVIELTRWGIVQGIPPKPYTNQHYVTANNNITGINNALLWASNNNFDCVVLPRGQYSICYPNSIKTQSNMTIDFNFSTLKVIYDSDVRSPLDTSTNPVYQFYGDSILCTTPYTHIINLKLIGERVDRSWTNLTAERLIETSNGIKFGSGANYSTIRNCNISYYMGDAIALYYSPYDSFDIGTMEFGDLDTSGVITTGATANTIRSTNFISLPSNITSFTMIGLGYAPTTSIPSGKYSVYFYKSDNTYIVRKTNVRTRDLVNIPKDAVKIKLTWEGNGTLDDGCLPNNPPYWAIMVKNGLTDNVLVEYNEIHRCHRGGIFLGTNNTVIRKNYFHDTGAPDNMDIDGLPTFPDGTRYAINTEDNVGQNCKIQDNVFDNIRLAIAIRGEFNEVSGNEFRNCGAGLQLYYLKHCLIDKNFFYYSGIGNFEYNNFDRNWSLTNNIFVGSSVNITGSGSTTTVTNNHFKDGSSFSSTIKVLIYKSNTFNNSYYDAGGDTLAQTNIDGCSFINNSSIRVVGVTTPFDKIIRCSFTSSYVLGQNSQQIIIKDSSLKESGFMYSTGTISYTFSNCKIDNTTRAIINNPNPADIGQVHHTLEIKDSIVNMGQKSLIESYYWGKIIINNSIINYIFTTNYTKVLQDTFGDITDSIDIRNTTITATGGNASQSASAINTTNGNITIVDNTFTNFSLINPSVNVITYDQSKPYIRVPIVGTSSPTITPQFIGQMFIDTVNKKIYQAVGTSDSTDWILLN